MIIYKTSREVLTALIEGKILKTVKPVYDIHRDKYITRHFKMDESEILEYDKIESVWYSSFPSLLRGGTEFECVEEIIEIVSINGLEFPKPVQEPLEDGTCYYLPYFINSTSEELFSVWDDHKVHLYRLKNNLIQLTKEGAEAQKLAMLSVLKEVVDKGEVKNVVS